MKNRATVAYALPKTLMTAVCAVAFLPAFIAAQVPVDDNGTVLGSYEAAPDSSATGNEDIPLLSTVDLEELVGPIALYPDDLLAIVLPAAAYPLQIVDAARFLEALENDPSLTPDPDWDESVVALLNYPEVIELLDDDIDWTWRLGEAVVAQQADVIAAVETFRDRAYAAGNLKSDTHQTVSRNDGIIEITPVALDEIYVPYYEPERVVVYQPRPVYYYYPRPCPVYYYPYSSRYSFDRRHFWGVTTAFTIGWLSDSLNVFHHSYFGHPYYGRSYWDRWWYRQPSINIHNTTYVGNNTRVTVNRYDDGDRWRPRSDRRDFADGQSFTRNREYPGKLPHRYVRSPAREAERQRDARRPAVAGQTQRRDSERQQRVREPIVFRERQRTATSNRNRTSGQRTSVSRVSRSDIDASLRSRGDTSRHQAEQRTRTRNERQSLERQSLERQSTERSTVTPRLRRPETSTAQRRHDPVAQTRRPDRVSRVGRTEDRHSTTRRETVRARPEVQTRRAEPAPKVRRSEPKRQEKSHTQTSSPRKARQSNERKSTSRERRRQ